jgi:hypothetical protein
MASKAIKIIKRAERESIESQKELVEESIKPSSGGSVFQTVTNWVKETQTRKTIEQRKPLRELFPELI